MTEQNNMVMSWDDEIVSDEQSRYLILPEGDYNFKVVSFERGHFPGGAKIGQCPKAVLKLEVKTDTACANAGVDLLLHRSLEWKIASFFRSIGQKKKGERLLPNWNQVSGSVGRAHFKPRVYTDKDGIEKKANNVEYFIDYDPQYFTPAGEEMGYEPF